MSRIMVVSFLFMKGLGWVDSLGSAARASRLHVFLISRKLRACVGCCGPTHISPENERKKNR